MAVRRGVVALLLAAGAALIAAFGFLYFRDNFFTHYPIKVISARIFRAAQIPWWNFYDGGGQPLAGNPNTLTFYPDNFLYLVLPPHVAFNLHFLIHIVGAWFAMRALCLQTGASRYASAFAATMYAMSGVAISATAFYNLVTAIALVPFAFWAVERSPLILGAAFGLIGLAGEPVIAISTGIGVLILGWRRLHRIAIAVLVAMIIASPQLIAYAEIAGEVERTVRFSTAATLASSLWPIRLAEIVVGPIVGFLTDPGHAAFRNRLFSTIFLGIIILPALATARRFRYLFIAALMLFLALGRFNPIVTALIDAIPRLRVARYPEKFAIALTVALVVIVAAFVDRLTKRWRTVWAIVTFVPLAMIVVHGTPIDWFAPYRVPPQRPVRVCAEPRIKWGTYAAREEYRTSAHVLPPIFGAVGGVRYGANRSPEGMHSLMSRIVVERVAATAAPIRDQYLRICGCSNTLNALPMAWIVPRAIGVHNVNEEVQLIESGRFDERSAALAPAQYANFVSPPDAMMTRYSERLQDIVVSVSTPAPALLFVNQSFFRAWSARSGDRELSTLPLDIDRLGVIVPAGQHTIELRFGRHRTAVAVAWLVSSLLLIAAVFVEIRDRRAGEVERAGDENRPLV